MRSFIINHSFAAPAMKLATLAVAVHCACGYAQTATNGNDRQDEQVISVVAPRQQQPQPDNKVTVSAVQMQKNGTTDFGSVMRYQPLIGATGVAGGSSAGKSGFDRAGYTGFNIRGLESNRVGLDVDGIPLPDATGRGYAGRAGVNTFGIGRDYIDPWMFGRVDIESGATAVSQPNTSIGGNVSFRNKSADDYLSPLKSHYFGYQSDYDSSNHGWHNGITAAGGDSTLRGIVVYSRRDGQQTRNNSGELSAFPANWHSDALMTSAIWQPNELHKFTATFDYFHKLNHTHYDSWNAFGTSVLGTAQQQSDTRRWGLSLADDYTPDNDWIDSLSSRVYYQHTEAHDNTWLPVESGSRIRDYSDYNTDTWGFDSHGSKTLGRHILTTGINGRLSDTARPFRQSPEPSVSEQVMQPQADSRSVTLGGFVQDRIAFNLSDQHFALIPGVRVAYQNTKAQNLSSLSGGSLSEAEAAKLYGSANSDTQILPSLTLEYDMTPTITSWIQYKRGAQFPDASQLYGSWNMGSSYAGSQQYALIGNSDLKTETSNNLEWGLKGEVAQGVTLSSSLFYNAYENFIAYTRYSRAGSPDKFVNVPSNIYTIYQAENRDKAYIWGGELSAKLNAGSWVDQLNGLSATFALGYNEGKAKSKFSGDRYVDLESVAPMKAVVGVAWDDPAECYGAALTATFVKGKRATATNRETYSNTGAALTTSTSEYMLVPGYGMVDMTAYWRLNKTVKLSGGVYNLTDRKYWDYLSSRDLTGSSQQDMAEQALAVMPGRTFQLGVNIDF